MITRLGPRWLVALCVTLLWPPIGHADVVELFDGTRYTSDSVTLENGVAKLADGRSIPRSEIRQILFDSSEAGDSAGEVHAGDTDVQMLLDQAQAAREKYPDVGAIQLIDTGVWTLRPDGTQLHREHAATLILKEPWKSLGRIAESYEDGRDRATLVRARTISPEGDVYDFDPAELKEAKPTGGMEYFQPYKTVTGQLPNVETGSIVETIWEVETYNPYDKELFFPRWYFGGTEPNLDSRVTIRVPRGRGLYYKAYNFGDRNADPKQWDEDDYHVYQWELSDVEYIVSEPIMPPVATVVPHVVASLHKDWDHIYDYLGRMQREHTQVTPEIEQAVAEIIGDSTDKEEIIAKIYHWLQREIRYISIKGSLGSGWSGHPATLTLKNKYGDCIDKATLFATMLKAAQIKAEPVVLATYSMPDDDREIPSLWGNHAITEVHLGDRSFHLDCTGTSFRYPYLPMLDHGVTTINMLERKIGRVEVPRADQNAISLNVRMKLEDNGDVKAVIKIDSNGSAEGFARQGLEQINKLLRKTVAQQVINSWSPGAELKQIKVSDDADLETPLEITLKILLPDYPSRAGDLMILKLPLADLTKSMAAIAALQQREFDILMPSTMSLRQNIRVDLPAGYTSKGLPEDAHLETPYTSYDASYRLEDGAIVFEDNLSLNARSIPHEDYGEFRRFMQAFSDYARVPLFIAKTEDEL